MTDPAAESGALVTMTPAEWLGALADAWQAGNDAGYSDGHSDVWPSEQASNPYRVTPHGAQG